MKKAFELLDAASAGSGNTAVLVNAHRSGAATEEASAVVSALSNVVTYMITDAFDLNPEENLWVTHHINLVLEPLKTVQPETMLVAVVQEMKTNEYSERLMRRLTDAPSSVGYTTKREQEKLVKYAPVSAWVEDISNVILQGYPNLRPMTRSSIVGSIHGLLIELGVSDDANLSRASRYLPSSVRHLMNAED